MHHLPCLCAVQLLESKKVRVKNKRNCKNGLTIWRFAPYCFKSNIIYNSVEILQLRLIFCSVSPCEDTDHATRAMSVCSTMTNVNITEQRNLNGIYSNKSFIFCFSEIIFDLNLIFLFSSNFGLKNLKFLEF